jgi:hypothetical protein
VCGRWLKSFMKTNRWMATVMRSAVKDGRFVTNASRLAVTIKFGAPRGITIDSVTPPI